jgi:hypothetical protein
MNENPYKGKKFTPAGVMPADKVLQHKLMDASGNPLNTPEDTEAVRPHYRDRAFKQQMEQLKGYLLLYRRIMRPRLDNNRRLAMHNLWNPLTRGGSEGGEMQQNRQLQSRASTDEATGADPQKVPLKV